MFITVADGDRKKMMGAATEALRNYLKLLEGVERHGRVGRSSASILNGSPQDVVSLETCSGSHVKH
jgi:hypothetical protein